MKKKMVDIMNAFHKYNSDNMAYLAGYLVEKDGLKIAWIKITASDSI